MKVLVVWLAAMTAACGTEPPADPPGTTGGSGGKAGGGAGAMMASGGGSSAGTAGAGSGEYSVPNQDFCAPSDGEVLAVDVAIPQLALGGGYLYLLASLGDVSGSSLELSRVPLPKGPRETLVTQALYGFDLGVRGDVVSWGTRAELPILLDEDYADFDAWTLDAPAGEANRLVQGGVMDLSLAPTGVVVSRFEPGRLELHTAQGMTALCPALGVNALLTDSEVVLWHTYRKVTVCPLSGGEAIEIDLNGETDPHDLQLDAGHAYWRLGDETGLWRAPLGGGPPEHILPDLEARSVRIIEQQAYVVPPDDARIDVVDLSSGSIETVASTEGVIAGLTADATHVYWVDYAGQWMCVKSAALK